MERFFNLLLMSLMSVLTVFLLFAVYSVGSTVNNHVKTYDSKALHDIMLESVVELQGNNTTLCTATQIGNTAFLSAGHCFGMANPTHVRKGEEVREIKSKHFKFEPGSDWAVFYTDEPIEGNKNLPLACEEEVYVTMDIATLGHPAPFLYDYVEGKVTGNTLRPRRGRVPGSDHFSDVMTGRGASGSSVVSMNTGGIVGVLVEGFFNNLRTSFRMGFQEITPVCKYIDSKVVANE